MNKENKVCLDTIMVSHGLKDFDEYKYNQIVQSDFNIKRIMKIGFKHPNCIFSILSILAISIERTHKDDIEIVEDKLFRIFRAYDKCFIEEHFIDYVLNMIVNLYMCKDAKTAISKVLPLKGSINKIKINGEINEIHTVDLGYYSGSYFELSGNSCLVMDSKKYGLIVIQDGVTKLYNYNTIKEDKDKKRIISKLENDDSVDLVIVAI